jgi:hypothetical protein
MKEAYLREQMTFKSYGAVHIYRYGAILIH